MGFELSAYQPQLKQRKAKGGEKIYRALAGLRTRTLGEPAILSIP